MKDHMWTVPGIAALVGLAILAIAGAVALAETLSWDESADFADGEFDATVWNAADGGVTLTGRDSLWKYRGNPILSKGAATTWDDEGIFEPTTLFAKGKYYMFYVGYSGSDYAIGMATSSDGKAFSKYASNPVLSNNPTGGTPDVTEVRDPFVIFENGTFKMWYTGVSSGTPSICYATSTSGTSWTRYASNPVLSKPSSGWGSASFGDPCVVKVDNKYYMYLSGASTANEELVGLATSKTGLSWTLYGSNPIIAKASSPDFGQKEIRDVAVLRDGPVWRLYFAGRDSVGDKYRLGSAFSYDGIGWVRNPLVVLDWSASGFESAQIQSPSVLWANDGLYLYFSGDNGGGTPNYQLGLAQLKPWFIKKADNPQLGTGSSYDANELTDPCVVFNEASNTYYMFYGCYGGGGSYPYAIAQASSTDGISWGTDSKYSSNPVLSKSGNNGDWDDERVQDPCVIYENGTYKMWYSGYDGSKWQIGYATSTATGGAGTWTKYGSNPVLKVGGTGAWDESNVKMPWVVKVGTTYHMWYVGSSTSGGTHIGHATSSNGLSWTRDAQNPVLVTAPLIDWEKGRIEQPCVLYRNGVYTMFYTGVRNSNYEVGKATSPDGSAWTRDPSGPICPRGNDTAWDDDGTTMGCVRVDGSYYHMYFSGYDGTYWQIGYAKWNSLGTATYTTTVLDAGASWPVLWGSLQWTARVPLGTSLRFQVATNRGGSIWNFVGPDGTSTSYFEDSGRTFFEYQSGSRIRVRAFLSTDDERLYLPLLRSVTVLYQRRAFGAPQVTVTSPNGGEDWMKTKTYPVTWVALGNLNSTSITLEYSTDNGTTWSSIADRQPNTGLYKWTVANTETSGALVRVIVTDIDWEVATDTSDATFAIDPPAPKSGAFLSPAEGAVLAPGQIEVRWTIDDPWGLAERPLSLELTTDGGTTWELLVDGLALSDSWSWEVRPIPRSSTACALRLSVLDWLGGISVVETGAFTIDMNSPTVTLSPLDGRPVEGKPLTVTADAVDDVAVRSVVLHVSASDGSSERTYPMSSEDGGWRCTFAPDRGDARMWAVAGDGARTSSSAVVPIELATESTAPAGVHVPAGLLGTALLGLAAAIGITAVLWRRRSG